MGYWTSEQIFESNDASHELVAQVAAIEAELAGLELVGPKLLGMEVAGPMDDPDEVTAIVELAPGLVIRTDYDAEVSDGSLAEAVDEFANEVAEGVLGVADHHDHLLARVGAVRREVRRSLADRIEEGLPCRLVDVQLAPWDGWRDPGNPRFVIWMETLGDALEPKLTSFEIERGVEIQRELEDLACALIRRRTVLVQLHRAGADGKIDLLALNAIARNGDVASQLRSLKDKEVLRLADGTILLWCDGRVEAMSAPGAAPLFQGACFTMSSMIVAPGRARQAIGRPATEIIDYPLLSKEMMVAEANSTVIGGKGFFDVRLEMPTRYFCASTGRVW